MYQPRRMSPEIGVGSSESSTTASTAIIPELAEDEAIDKEYLDDDGDRSIFSEVSEMKNKDLLGPDAAAAATDLGHSKNSTVLSDAFSLVFNPGEDIHNFWSTFRFLQHSPRKVLFDTSMIGGEGNA